MGKINTSNKDKYIMYQLSSEYVQGLELDNDVILGTTWNILHITDIWQKTKENKQTEKTKQKKLNLYTNKCCCTNLRIIIRRKSRENYDRKIICLCSIQKMIATLNVLLSFPKTYRIFDNVQQKNTNTEHIFT